GHYLMTITMPGYESATRAVDIAIGKPYSFVLALSQQRGHLRIRATPPDARIFIDDGVVGAGSWDGQLVAGRYDIRVEAPGFVTQKKTIAIAPLGEEQESISLEPTPSSGRLDLVIAGGVAGALGGGSIG